MVYLGVDLGGTGIKVGLVTEKGEILAKGSTPTLRERPYQAIIEDIANLCKRVVRDAKMDMADVGAIGVGVPGICDPNTGIIPFCTNLGWHKVPFVEEMHKHIDKPVIVDNDATVAGFAESIAGVSAGSSSSVFLTLGTGVGGAIIINGKPYSGAHGVGSELGHMIIRVDGDPCNCGNAGCFERYASATAIIRMAKEVLPAYPNSRILTRVGGDQSRINAKTVIDCAKEGDPAALAAFGQYVKGLATGIVNIIHTLDPEVIALGGGVSMAGDFLLDAVRREIPKMVMYKTMPFARIELAQLGADAGIIGAALLGKQ
ncbi:MAG: ROK family protein [Clostridia bacterium]|nr:ROK family protein [Clostridia bacterium]